MTSLRRIAGSSSFLLLLSVGVVIAMPTGCQPKNPCDKGFAETPNEQCAAIPVSDGGAEASNATTMTTIDDAGTDAADGEADGSGSDGAATKSTETFFGKDCSSADQCGGDAPVCAVPYLPYCTQINCAAGEANANACPAGWICMSVPGQPSGCLKQ